MQNPKIPELTAQHCNDVIDQEVTLGSINIPSHQIDHKITYYIKNSRYYVYIDGAEVYTTKFEQNALDYYNDINKKVDL